MMSILVLLLAVFPFLVGLYYEWGVSLSVILLTILLFWTIGKRRRLTLYLSTGSVCLFLIFLSAVISLFSGIAAGSSFYGVLRVAGVLELVLLLMQEEGEEKSSRTIRSMLLCSLPWAGLFYFLVSLIFYLIPGLCAYVYIDGRFGGLMGYANVTAVFLLTSLVCESENPVLPGSRAGKLLSVFHPLLMAFGIFWTGSRIIAALLLLFWLSFLIRKRESRRKNFLIGAGLIAPLSVYLANVDHYTSLGRFREIFQVNSSTMIRPAYWLDAVRALLTRPLGFGYEGFFISQGTIQSGPYYVRWLHNGFLECAYSFGWAAGIAMIVLTAWALRTTKGLPRVLLFLFTLRNLMDFDLQFLALVYLCIACMEWKRSRKYSFSFTSERHYLLPNVIASVLLALSAWIGTASFAAYRGDFRKAAQINPNDWEYQLQSMPSEDQKEKEETAKRVVALNPCCSTAWLTLCSSDIERGDPQGAVVSAVRAVRHDSTNVAKMENAYQLILSCASSDGRKFYAGELRQLCDLAEEVMGRKNPFCRKAGYTVDYTDLLSRMKTSLTRMESGGLYFF